MQTFATARDAKEFLVSRIVTESQHEGVPLSEIERKMLYFSETGWTLPDIWEVNDAFDRDYDRAEYEHKIGTLIRNFCANARKNSRDELDTWKEAVRTLRREDHYILVLIDVAEGSLNAGGEESPSISWSRFLKLLAIAFVIFIAVFILASAYLFIKR